MTEKYPIFLHNHTILIDSTSWLQKMNTKYFMVRNIIGIQNYLLTLSFYKLEYNLTLIHALK